MFKEFVDQDGMFRLVWDLFGKIGGQLGVVIDHGHGPAAKDVAGPHHHGIGNTPRHLAGALQSHGRPVRGLQQAQFLNKRLEAFAVLGAVNGIGRRPQNGHARAHERHGKVERRLPAELHDDAFGLFLLDDVHHILKGQRLEIETVGRIVVGGDGFGVRIDHDGHDPGVAQGKGGMAAAVVKLDALPDAVGAAAKDDNLAPVFHHGFPPGFVGGIVIGRIRLKFRGAGIHKIEGRLDAEALAQAADVVLGAFPHFRQLAIGEPELLGVPQDIPQFGVGGRHVVGETEMQDALFHLHDVADLADEPRVNAAGLVDFLLARAGQQRLPHAEDAAGTGRAQGGEDLFLFRQFLLEMETEPRRAGLHGAEPLLQRLLEGSANAHGLAHALHGRRELILRAGKLLKGEARDLHHAVVNGGLKTGGRLPGDVVPQFIQRIAHGQLGGDLGDGEARRLGCQRRRTGHARIHLNDDHLARGGIDAELHVAAAGLHADFTHDGQRGVAHGLIFHVAQRLRRSHGNGVAGMHAHGIKVLNGTDNDGIVVPVAHDLHLKLFPPQHALLNHDFGSGTRRKAAPGDLLQILHVVGHAAARASQRKRRAHNKWKRQHIAQTAHVVHRAGNAAGGYAQADVLHGLTEKLTAFGLFDDIRPRADEFHAAFLQHAKAGKPQGRVQRRLAAQRGQQGVRAFLADNGRERFGFDRLHIGGVGHMRISHDGGGIGVDQHHLVAFLFQGLDGLGAGIVEFAALPDDDGPGPDDHNLMNIRALRHENPLIGCVLSR